MVVQGGVSSNSVRFSITPAVTISNVSPRAGCRERK
jgi:hypothetical protein